MATKKIGDRTVKEILENLLGPQKAKNVLAKIQEEYDNPKGLKGDKFKDFAISKINEETNRETQIGKESVVVAVTVEGIFSGGYPER